MGREDVEPPGAVWLDDHCYLWVGDEVGQVGGDDEGGEGVLGVGPVLPLLLLLNVAREEQGRHTAGYQTAPVWFLWQITHGLLPSPVFAQKGHGRWRQPCCGQCCRCELENKSGHWGTQCKSGKLSSCSMPEYARVSQGMSEYDRVYQSMQEYVRVCQSMQEYARVCQSMPEYARVCQCMPEYTRVCQSMPEYV